MCVSSVPASCVHIWFVSCPCFMSLWVKYVPAVFVSLCVNYPLYISPVFWVWFRLVYSLLPRCILSLSPALSYLDVIKYYYLSLYPRLRVPVPPSCVHRDRRRDSNTTGSPLTQCPPDRRWLMPAGLPLTQAHRIAADSCPLAATIPSPVDLVHLSRPGVPCVCLVVPTGTF